jgi:hypothetical protein
MKKTLYKLLETSWALFRYVIESLPEIVCEIAILFSTFCMRPTTDKWILVLFA